MIASIMTYTYTYAMNKKIGGSAGVVCYNLFGPGVILVGFHVFCPKIAIWNVKNHVKIIGFVLKCWRNLWHNPFEKIRRAI